MNKVTLIVRADDAEPILRQAAEDAAKFGAWCDYITVKTYDAPGWLGMSLPDAKKEWQARFLRAKRTVESFGVEYKPTDEGETMTIHIPYKVLKSHLVKAGGVTFRHIDKSEPDPKRAMPEYRRQVHAEACRQAATRVVRTWKAMMAQEPILPRRELLG